MDFVVTYELRRLAVKSGDVFGWQDHQRSTIVAASDFLLQDHQLGGQIGIGSHELLGETEIVAYLRWPSSVNTGRRGKDDPVSVACNSPMSSLH